jgi:hypoxanthine-DNA glycosylase
MEGGKIVPPRRGVEPPADQAQVTTMTESPPSQAFDPVVNTDTRALVLGSLPGRISLRENRYYAHPQNQFWRLMSGVTGVDLVSLSYKYRIDALLNAGIGLWDVIASAHRRGSLDSAILSAQIRHLATMITTLPSLRAVAFNGRTALRFGLKQLGAATGPESAIQ